MNYKFFVTRFGVDAESNIKKLRKEFPGMSFKVGIHKDKRGIYCLLKPKEKEFGESWELENGDIFFEPTQENKEKLLNSLSDFKTEPEDRIKVKLAVGKEIEIYPASAIPQKVLFSKKLPKQTEETPFNTIDPYGKMAYDLFGRANRGEQLRFDDPEFLKFIELALTRSYKLPMPIWDSLGIISYKDFDPIFAAACGVDWENLLKISRESNGQP